MRIKHTPQRTETKPFSGPVHDPIRAEPRAHGGCTLVQHCKCGAWREINASAGYREVGRWLPPQPRP